MKRLITISAAMFTAAAAITASGFTVPAIGAPKATIDTSRDKPVLKKKPSIGFATYKFECRAQGSPVEFPDDIVIINKAKFVVPAGTKVGWKMAKTGWSGTQILPTLLPGQHVFISHALPSAVVAGHPCTVWVK